MRRFRGKAKHKRSVYSRIEKRLDKTTSECWLWTGAVSSRGYGNIGIEGSTQSVHRAYWEELNGPIPEGMFICHTCDTPLCVNLEHLFVGTMSDNMQDMSLKGRAANAQRTHCKQGHAFEERPAPGRQRTCRICARRRSLEFYQRRKRE